MPFHTDKGFDKIFTDLYPKLVVFANKIIRDIDASEDLVQDVFLYLYQKKNQIHLDSTLSSYLYKAVFNRCKSHQRKLFTQEKYEAEIQLKDVAEYRDFLEESEFEKQIHDLILKLPEKCREVFTLSRFEDLSNQEIAQRLNISKRTVETQISKALKILRKNVSPTNLFFFFL